MNTKKHKTDVLVVGGSASGVCAAIQAARQGVRVVLVEETGWLGGMLTAAGVSCVDGNYHLRSGLWGAFCEALFNHYGGPEKVKTGWVSNVCFEPSVGNAIFHDWVSKERNITQISGYTITGARVHDKRLTGAQFINDNGEPLSIDATLSVDCTELGDLAALAGCDYRVGRESRQEFGESPAPENRDTLIQDLTYVAVLEEGVKDPVPRPASYNPAEFRNCCREFSDPDMEGLVSAEEMLNYGRLPNGKFMINWPKQGNDYFLNSIEMNPVERKKIWQDAKNRTLAFVYFIRNELGFRHLGLARREFPTADRLALIPYHRESLRIVGKATLCLGDILDPYNPDGPGLYRHGVAVGDYPLDHHHSKVILPEPEEFPSIPAFNIPYGCLVPQSIDGLLVAEKSISVTHVVNGCTRLQPVVMQIGQAAGAAAALCVKNGISPSELNIRTLQQTLLDAGCRLMPFRDTTPSSADFQALQKIGLCGILEGELISKDWANECRIHPDQLLTGTELISGLEKALGKALSPASTDDFSGDVTLGQTLLLMWQVLGRPASESHSGSRNSEVHDDELMSAYRYFESRELLKDNEGNTLKSMTDPVTRAEFAVLFDAVFAPFERI